MNVELKFWLTFCSLITLLEIIFFILFCVFNPTFIFHKEYCLILIPNLLYIGFQFILNYINLTSINKNESECKK